MTPVSTPAPEAVAELAERLRKGGWTFMLHGDGRDQAYWWHRSVLDPRVTVCKVLHRRQRTTTVAFNVDLEAGNVTIPGEIEEGEEPFANLSAVAEFILAHQAALAQEGTAP